MPPESATAKTLSPAVSVDQAKQQLRRALARLEKAVESRVQVASSKSDSGEDASQWQNACNLLQEQTSVLKDENSRLNGEIHHIRERYKKLSGKAETLMGMLDETIVQVETLIKDA